MRGQKLAIFLAMILVTMFVCKTFLPIDGNRNSTTASIEDEAVAN